MYKEIAIKAKDAIPVVKGKQQSGVTKFTVSPDVVRVEYWLPGMDKDERKIGEYPIDNVVLSGFGID